MHPLINVLIRNKYRPELFRRCIDSIISQTYKSVRVIILSDNHEGYQQSIPHGETMYVRLSQEYLVGNYWNLYCNILKECVTEGFFFFLDNDDVLASPTVLHELSKHLEEDKGLIVQFLRNGRPKPNDRLIKQKKIVRGNIGGGCLILPAKFKHIADWQGREAADYFWINEVQQKVDLKFVPLVLQITDQKNNGK